MPIRKIIQALVIPARRRSIRKMSASPDHISAEIISIFLSLLRLPQIELKMSSSIAVAGTAATKINQRSYTALLAIQQLTNTTSATSHTEAAEIRVISL